MNHNVGPFEPVTRRAFLKSGVLVSAAAVTFPLALRAKNGGESPNNKLNSDRVGMGTPGAREFHVAISGSDLNPGSQPRPFRTISRAARVAEPGDVVTVHGGIYRERVNPPRGGTSEDQRIVYRAAPGEKVVITGSEMVKGWEKLKNDTWRVALPNAFFGGFNPYRDELSGPWFKPNGRKHHTGAVYLNGGWLGEAATLGDVLQAPVSAPRWFGMVGDTQTTIWAQFPGVDPNRETVEINARQSVFFPCQPGRNFITVRGFILRDAATPWPAPVLPQIGLIGPNWSRGWIIEDNVISHATTAGLSLGTGTENFGKFAGTVKGMNALLRHASESGMWNRERVGGHIVRYNRIFDCGVAGIDGNMGGAFSLIEGNHISDIDVGQTFSGLEQGGIKLHAAVDTVIRDNVVSHIGGRRARAIWLDWLAQGTVVEDNIAYDNANTDFYIEVSHGPTLVANNVFLSKRSAVLTSQGIAFVNNYFGGSITVSATKRITPYLEPHSTTIAGLFINNQPGDVYILNNIFAGRGPALVAGWGGVQAATLLRLPFTMDGNVYIAGAQPPAIDKRPSVLSDVKPTFVIQNGGKSPKLVWTVDPAWRDSHARKAVTAEQLGRTSIGKLQFEWPDGSPIRIDRDFFGTKREVTNVMPGPIAKAGAGSIDLADWVEMTRSLRYSSNWGVSPNRR